MPLVRIDLRKGKSVRYRQTLGQTVYEALVSVGAPENDRFQIITEHEDGGLIYDPNYFGVERGEDFVIIQIAWGDGRTVDQKKALYKAIAEGLETSLGMRQQDVFIGLIDVPRENWSFGNGVAQLAP